MHSGAAKPNPSSVFHILHAAELGVFSYAPRSLQAEGFIHASFADQVAASCALYFAGARDLWLYELDRAALGKWVHLASTPRGPMPHVTRALLRADVLAIHAVATWLPPSLEANSEAPAPN